MTNAYAFGYGYGRYYSGPPPEFWRHKTLHETHRHGLEVWREKRGMEEELKALKLSLEREEKGGKREHEQVMARIKADKEIQMAKIRASAPPLSPGEHEDLQPELKLQGPEPDEPLTYEIPDNLGELGCEEAGGVASVEITAKFSMVTTTPFTPDKSGVHTCYDSVWRPFLERYHTAEFDEDATSSTEAPKQRIEMFP